MTTLLANAAALAQSPPRAEVVPLATPGPAVSAPASVSAAPAASTPAEPPVPAPVTAVEPALPTVATPQVSPPDPAAAAATPPATAPVRKVVPSPAQDEALFPHYDSLRPAVAFWTRVFGELSENQTAVHSSEYPDKVFQILDFRNEALEMDPQQLSRYRADVETKAKVHVDKLLKEVSELRTVPDKLNEEQRQIWRLFADVPGDNRFKSAIGTFRCQRGLKERTALAVETSGRYLPEMESIFRRYQLPLQLTRLPLVESSFNIEAYSKVGAAGLWQFIPSSAKIYMRLNEVVDDRRDPWTSTDAAARHLRDDYDALGSWPLALTAYNHGRGGIAHGLKVTGGTILPDLIAHYDNKSFGFASKNFYAEFLAASDVERNWQKTFGDLNRGEPLRFDTVETKNFVPYETLRRLCDADDDLFRRLNPAYRPEVIEGKLYVPPGHLIRVPAGHADAFNVAYSKLGPSERFDAQRIYFLLHKVAKSDTLGKIAHKYGVSQAAILSANGLKDKVRLKIGMVIKVPPHEESRPGPVLVAVGESQPALTRAQSDAQAVERVRDEQSAPPPKPHKKAVARLHKVRSGQTLSGIAKQYKISVAELRSANGLSANSRLKVGQQLKIPVG